MIKLADFGLAKTVTVSASESEFRISNETTKTGVLKGTRWYVSPEALQGVAHRRDRSPADDIWSACLVILEMDTGMNLQQLMIAPGAIDLAKVLLNASSFLLPLLYMGLIPDARSRCSCARELLRMLDAVNDQQFEWQEYDGSDFVPVQPVPAAAFLLERSMSLDLNHESFRPTSAFSVGPQISVC